VKSGLPDFILIGAAKSGTTSLYHYLKQHPGIYMSPVKEPKYFSLVGSQLDFSGPGDTLIQRGTTTTLEDYRQLFEDAPAHSLCGEASTIYLDDPQAAARIMEAIPQAKLMVVLRHPADRAYSAYMHLVRDGWEQLGFEEALKAEQQRREDNYYYYWRYQDRGFYGRALQEYYKLVPREQIKVFLHEDLEADPHRLLAEMFAFLGLETDCVVDVSARHNRSGIPQNAALSKTLTGSHPLKQVLKTLIPERLGHRLVSKIQAATLKRPPLREETRRRLIEIYRQDINLLSELIDRDLTHWLV